MLSVLQITCQSLENVHLVLCLKQPSGCRPTFEWSVSLSVAKVAKCPTTDDLTAFQVKLWLLLDSVKVLWKTDHFP